jgi:hypothetical protein
LNIRSGGQNLNALKSAKNMARKPQTHNMFRGETTLCGINPEWMNAPIAKEISEVTCLHCIAIKRGKIARSRGRWKRGVEKTHYLKLARGSTYCGILALGSSASTTPRKSRVTCSRCKKILRIGL